MFSSTAQHLLESEQFGAVVSDYGFILARMPHSSTVAEIVLKDRGGVASSDYEPPDRSASPGSLKNLNASSR
jgi:hypothetical protein